MIGNTGCGASSGTQYTVRATQLKDLINGLLSRRGARRYCGGGIDAQTHRRAGRQLGHAGRPDLLRSPALFARIPERSARHQHHAAILPLRPIRTARKYRKIWTAEGSPLAVYSRRLTAKLASALQARFGDSVRVELAMTYGNPNVAGALCSLAGQNVDRLLVLPLYPQYCSSTTGSVFDRTSGALQRWRWLPETRFVNDYYHDAGYIEALAARVLEHWATVGERSHLLVSYHGIPASYVAAGDPYQIQAEATTRLLASRLSLAPDMWTHCYQSRFGRVEWLQPYTEDALKSLASRGVRKLSVVSPSFAVDCLETLEEIAIDYRDKFLALGGERLTLVPALNDDDRHAQVLAAIVGNELQGWTTGEPP
jgi:protoporphyrin/coproporphyrin ferrochelatase